MHRTTRGLVLALAVALSASAIPAQADANVCVKAYNVRAAVVKKFGKRAPGRNICRFGVKHSDGKVRPARFATKKRYLLALRALNTSLPMMVAGTPRVPPASTATPRAGGHLAAIRACESGGNYATNTGNGFYGAYQFTQSTWASVGGTGNPAAASPAEQDRRAAMLYARSGPGQWPVCGR